VKRIEAIIGPLKLDGVKAGVLQTGARGMTISDIRELGRLSSRREAHRDPGRKLEFAPKVHIQIVAPDDMVAAIVEAIVRASRTGRASDDRIIVSPVSDAVRIRTGEHGNEAV
jgi:nitrogen regulatory protein P-II 1